MRERTAVLDRTRSADLSKAVLADAVFRLAFRRERQRALAAARR
jgi:hypothetical protein